MRAKVTIMNWRVETMIDRGERFTRSIVAIIAQIPFAYKGLRCNFLMYRASIARTMQNRTGACFTDNINPQHITAIKLRQDVLCRRCFPMAEIGIFLALASQNLSFTSLSCGH